MAKMGSDKYGVEKEFGELEQEIEEKEDWEIVEMEEKMEGMIITHSEGNVVVPPAQRENLLLSRSPNLFINANQGEIVEAEFAEIVKKCEQLEEADDVEQLALFLNSLPPAILQTYIGVTEPVLRARAIIFYHKGNFKELYSLLESHNFSLKFHRKLQQMWFDAHYQEEKQILGREGCLDLVEEYIVRKRFPCPPTIYNAEMERCFFKEIIRKRLHDQYLLTPYLDPAKKKQLANETGLSKMEVGSWFKNRRQRDRARGFNVNRN